MRQAILYIPALTIILFSCDKKDHDKENSQYICNYKVLTPHIALEEHSDYSIDVDGDLSDDLTFTSFSDEFGILVSAISNHMEISKGIMPFSGSYHVIKENDTINQTLNWSPSLPLVGIIENTYYGEEIDFLGLRKIVDDVYYYGWLAVETLDSSFKLKEIYLLNSYTIPVLAGIINEPCSEKF